MNRCTAARHRHLLRRGGALPLPLDDGNAIDSAFVGADDSVGPIVRCGHHQGGQSRPPLHAICCTLSVYGRAIVVIGPIHLHYTLPHPLLYSNFNLHFPFSSVFWRNFRLRGLFIDCLQKKSKKVKFTH